MFVLGPLGGLTAAYMNFSLGFFVGGQVLAGILGSVVTYGYGSEGKHGANYMQTAAASVATLCGMAVLIQAMTWLGIPQPPAWLLTVYFTAIGMFGIGLGMLYTPILVDRMQLPFPSGYAVANILRSLTDKQLLRQSIFKLGGGTGIGLAGGFVGAIAAKIQGLKWLASSSFGGSILEKLQDPGISTSTLGAGMVVGARITTSALLVGFIGICLTPYLKEIGWLREKDPFRKIGFLIALGMILGAALVDLFLISIQAVQRFREKKEVPPAEDWKKVNTNKLIAWVFFWGIAVYYIATSYLNQNPGFVLLALVMAVVFVLINGIADGISDSNPISNAFVMGVFLMAWMGLKDPKTGLMCASILLISCGVGVDMQQDRSTGWRLGTNRVIQFRYQVVGIISGALLAVAFAQLFMNAYPVLQKNIYENPGTEGAAQWQSAMTFKIVGALSGLTQPKPYLLTALLLGLLIGLFTEILRKCIKNSRRYIQFVSNHKHGKTTDFLLDGVLLPSPYASSFGGFVDFSSCAWFALGGTLGSLMDWISTLSQKSKNSAPADMSTVSLIGGGLIAGDSLAALAIGIVSLLRTIS